MSTVHYGVSTAAQRLTRATVGFAKSCHKLLVTAKAEAAAGQATAIYRKVDLANP